MSFLSPIRRLVFQGAQVPILLSYARGILELRWKAWAPALQLCLFWTFTKERRGGKICVGAEMSGTAPWPFSQPNSSDKWAGLEPGDLQTHLDDFTEISWPIPPRARTSSGCAADMANQTNASTPYDSYEDYLDYLDLIPVDERKLKANKCEFCTGEPARQRLGGGPEDKLTSYSNGCQR